MTSLLRLILILALPAFALAAIGVGLVMGAKAAGRTWISMWWEA